MKLTKNVVYVEESSFRTIPVAVKDILVMQFIPNGWSDGEWATAYIYIRGTREPLREPRLFWIDPFGKQNLSKKAEVMIANIFPQSDFFQVALLGKTALGGGQYLVIYGPEVNITEDRMTFKNKEDSHLVFHIDPDISWKFREAFMDWERRKDEDR